MGWPLKLGWDPRGRKIQNFKPSPHPSIEGGGPDFRGAYKYVGGKVRPGLKDSNLAARQTVVQCDFNRVTKAYIKIDIMNKTQMVTAIRSYQRLPSSRLDLIAVQTELTAGDEAAAEGKQYA